MAIKFTFDVAFLSYIMRPKRFNDIVYVDVSYSLSFGFNLRRLSHL